MYARKLIISTLISTGAAISAPVAYAEAPVIDLTQQSSPAISPSNSSGVTTAGIDNPASASTSTLTVPQRVEVLERQLTNFTQMDLVGQISRLQQEMAKLRGQLDVQTYELKRLSEQVKAQYQDIDNRLSSQPAKASAKSTSASIVTTATSPAKPAKPIIDPLQTSTSSTSAAETTVAKESSADISAESQEQQAYQAAIDFSKKGDYVRATTAFQNYLSKYPNGKFAANGHYWLGEIYLIQGQPDPAAAEFKTIISSFPSTPKVPDALLKLGQAYYDKGDWKQAREHFQKVQKQFPNTSAALTATSKLQKMQQEGKGK